MTDGDESLEAQKKSRLTKFQWNFSLFFFLYSRSIKIAFTKNAAAAPKFILEKEIFLHSQMAYFS